MTPDKREAPVRVAMVIAGYHPLIGGAERQLLALAPRLQAHGVDVHVITRRYPGLKPFETVAGVPVHRLAAPGTRATRSFVFTLAALRRIARLRPDVVHAHELYSPTTVALLAKGLLDIPAVAKVPRGGDQGSIARLSRRALGRQRVAWLCRGVDAFVVISRDIDGELEAVGVPPERRVAIPNGVDSTHFTPLPESERSRLRRTLDLPRAGPVAIYTGRLAWEKGLGDLLAAWRAVREVYSDASLLLVGTGDQRTALESRAGEGVRFPGPIPDVAPYLQAADLFVLPSTAEGLSNALLEAMSTGLPCIGTAVGGTPDLIDHGNSGWLVPPGDPGRLQQAILTLLADRELRDRLGRRARLQVESRYSLAQTAAATQQLYRRLLKPLPRAGAR